MSALWPIQKAAVARLKGNAAFMARVTGVHDGQAPQGATMPYVVIGEPTETSSRTLERAGWVDTLTMHIFSAYAGRKEALEIATLMDAALAAPLALDGHTSARLKPEFRTVLVEEGGVRHAPIRYRLFTLANA